MRCMKLYGNEVGKKRVGRYDKSGMLLMLYTFASLLVSMAVVALWTSLA